MAMRIRFQYPTGQKLGYSIERLADGLLYDFATSAFSVAPKIPIANLPEDSGIFLGRYKATLTPTPVAQFTDGDYAVTIHDQAEVAASVASVVAELGCVMHLGDDATIIPQAFPTEVLVSLPAIGPLAFQVSLMPITTTVATPVVAVPIVAVP